MNRSKILKYSVWALAPLIGAAAMLSFLYFRDRGSETFEPPAAIGEQGLPGTPVAAGKIQKARDFKGFPLYWLGDSFQSLALTHADIAPEAVAPTLDSASFTYGTCTPRPGGEGCALPLDILVEPLCFTPPERIAGVTRADLQDFRGAKALWIDDHLRIWTGDTTIAIFGYPRERIQAAADALAPLGNIEVTLSDSKLPPPNFDSCPEIPLYPTSPPLPTRIPTPQTATP
jgi:hypothetical protein